MIFVNLKIPSILLVALALLLAACQTAKGPSYQPEYFALEAPKDPNNALVYIYRTEQEWRAKSSSWPAIYLNEILVGGLKYKSYLVAEVPPGEYTLMATGLSQSSKRWDLSDRDATFTLKSGHVRFFQLTAKYDQGRNNMLGGKMEFLTYLTAMEHDDARRDMYGLNLSE